MLDWVFFLIEMVKGRPVSEKNRERASQIRSSSSMTLCTLGQWTVASDTVQRRRAIRAHVFHVTRSAEVVYCDAQIWSTATGLANYLYSSTTRHSDAEKILSTLPLFGNCVLVRLRCVSE